MAYDEPFSLNIALGLLLRAGKTVAFLISSSRLPKTL